MRAGSRAVRQRSDARHPCRCLGRSASVTPRPCVDHGSRNETKRAGPKELRALADHIRSFLVDAGARAGGPGGPGSGLAELAGAAHRTFDSEKGRR
ncbi:1-deoxy-D-xylulose-5-phosphate synthase N-terminal domain-containing protein [Prauserella shujinwangii]|uniref:1-deoxy-D-xylulose-5-phosphate synthase N-terminal domain-containing protein n=1 Tax=Prauserella shujinwangii TaxID=1453103 RepID=UPI003CCC43F9